GGFSERGKPRGWTGTQLRRSQAGHEIDIKAVEYLRQGARPLLARLYVPRGDGPFPMVVDLHGGAWCRGDRLSDAVMNEPLARSGVVVAALDFRMPPDATYPGSLMDITYGIRWLKSRAKELHGPADRVGVLGASSGGDPAKRRAAKPAEPENSALPPP